jgi:hypothetical protein
MICWVVDSGGLACSAKQQAGASQDFCACAVTLKHEWPRQNGLDPAFHQGHTDFEKDAKFGEAPELYASSLGAITPSCLVWPMTVFQGGFADVMAPLGLPHF